MPAFVSLLIANLPAIIKGGKDIIAWAKSTKDSLNRTGEWTDADEAAFNQLLEEWQNSEHWKTDAEVGQE